MDINILQLIDGAKKARGLAVIIDVFRAMTVEAYIMKNGAKLLMPVGDKEIAYDYKKKNQDVILIGERNGVMLPGFDYGNSPSQIENVDFSGKTVVHTTSAGTQGIDNALNADEIITGAFVNAKAIAGYIKKKSPETVSLVCMGYNAQRPIEEDTLCAEYIKSIIEGNPIDLTRGFENIRRTSGAKFFDEANKTVFPQKDYFLCLNPDVFDFVLKVQTDGNGSNYIEKC